MQFQLSDTVSVGQINSLRKLQAANNLGAVMLTRLTLATFASKVVKPFILADIGEGIAEVQILNWYIALCQVV